MYDFIYGLILSTKYVSVTVLMFVFPSETVMPIVGYTASLGYISLLGAIIAGLIGATLWSVLIYSLARLVGPQGLEKFISRYGKFLGVQKSSVDRAGKWFDRHAGITVFIGKFIPGLRTAVCIPAGLRRMPFGRYLGYSVLGSGVDGVILAYLGYSAHEYFDELLMILDNVSNVIVFSLVVLAVGWWLWRRFRSK